MRRRKPTHIAGLDVGTSFVRSAIAEHGISGDVSLIGLGEVPSRGLRKGAIINLDATVSAIGAAIEQAEKMAGVSTPPIICSISGEHLRGFPSNGIVGVRGREVSRIDVEKVISAAKAVSIPSDREVLHILPQEYIIDGQEGIQDPIGMSGVRLECNVYVISGSITAAQNLVKSVNRCGVKVKDLLVSSLASASSVISEEEQELGVCLIDIGAGTTDITIYKDSYVKYTAVLPFGGSHITNALAQALKAPIAAVEKIKCEYGTLLNVPHSAQQLIQVPSTGGRAPRGVSPQVLTEVIGPVARMLFERIKDKLIEGEVLDAFSSGIVLTGGGAKLSGMVELAEDVFELPTRVGYPTRIKGLKDMVTGPEYATVVGLILYGAHISSIKPFSEDKGFLKRTANAISNWFVENF